MAKTERVEAIDGLRGVAALGVVLYHYVAMIAVVGIPVGRVGSAVVFVTRYGYLGVPIFFVLSGYVIAMTASRYTFTPRIGARFVLRRLVRLVPPYWVMVVLIAGAMVAGRAAGYFKHTTVSPGQVAAHFVYAQNLLGVPPLDLAFWTLCLEVQFYLVFAASAVLVRRASPRVHLVWFTALTVVSAVLDLTHAVPQAWFPLLWYQFGVGVLAFEAGRDPIARRTLWLLLPVLAGIGLARGQAADLTVAAVGGLLLLAARGAGAWPTCPATLLGLGRISYSLYLVHGFIGIGLGVAFRSGKIRSEPTAWIAVVAGTVAAIGFATLFYQLCERRGVDWSRRVAINPPPPPAPAPLITNHPDHQMIVQ